MQQAEEKRSVNRIGLIFLLLGGLATLFVCGLISVGVYLDLFGAEAEGEMTNISYDADRSDNPFTAQVTFKTPSGKEVSFISWHGSFYFDLEASTKPDGTPENAILVRYLENNPKIAKVSFAYHTEYINRIIWLFWSGVALMIGVITRRNKPLTIDLSKKNG